MLICKSWRVVSGFKSDKVFVLSRMRSFKIVFNGKDLLVLSLALLLLSLSLLVVFLEKLVVFVCLIGVFLVVSIRTGEFIKEDSDDELKIGKVIFSIKY